MANALKFRWHDAIIHERTMPQGVKLAALALWAYTDKSGENAHPGNKRLAHDLGASERTIERQLAWLRNAAWITRTSDSNSHPSRTWADVYRLNIPAAASYLQCTECRPTARHPDVGRSKANRNTQQPPETGPPGNRPPDKSDRPPDIYARPPDTQMSDQQVFTTTLLHHSDSSESGPRNAPTSTPSSDAFEDLQQWLTEQLGYEPHNTTLEAFWTDHHHPHQILNYYKKREKQ